MNEITTSQMKGIQLEILADIDKFCKDHSIRYSLCGGSLLGAIRHRGYIPWDDDIDLMMPRVDYDRFVKVYQSSRNYIMDFSLSDSFRETFVKVCRQGTVMVDDLLERSSFGVNVDIFPIDGVPKQNPHEYVMDIICQKETIAKYCAYYKKMRRNRFVWFVKYLVKRITSLYFGSVISKKSALENHLRSCLIENSSFAGVITGSYGTREIVDSSVFDCFEDMMFEDLRVSCISAYDTYLTSIYGDYMKLPPEDKRKSHHNYKVYTFDSQV